jgi:hypothetical protein
MKARTLITMTGAILALSASAAQASVQSALPAKHSTAAAHKIVAKKATTQPKTAITQPLYIYLAPTTQSAPVDNAPAYDGSMICPDGNTLDEDCGVCNPA